MKFQLEMTSPHFKFMIQKLFSCAGAQCHLCLCDQNMVRSTLSSQVALRGIPWSDGKMLEIPYLYDNLGARLLSEGVLDHQISKGRISSVSAL